MKILVVDDDKIIRMGLRALINRLFDNHEVISDFKNGLMALDYLKENNVDIVITDIKMPIMTGDELIKEAIRVLEKPPIFIVLSGYDEFTYVRDTMKYGAFNYLLKPINEEQLVKLFQEVEIKIKDNRKRYNIISKSIDVLRKDFFKHVLFYNLNLDYKTDKSLLENIQINEDYIYKLIIIQREKGNEKELLNKFIQTMKNSFNNLQHVFFYLEDNIYIVFYFDGSEENYIHKLSNEIINLTTEFIKNDRNVYILESTDKIHHLREQSKNFRKIKGRLTSENKIKQFILNISNETIVENKDEEEKTNLVAVKLAKEYIISNFSNNITLKEVADKVFLSQNYLSELFKKEMGEGFYEFLSRYRINVAKDLLVSTNLRIYEISERVGYNDPVTFGRAFKKVTGFTPVSFRNNKCNFK